MTRYRMTAHIGAATIATTCAELATALALAREFRDRHGCTVTIERGARCVAVCTPRERHEARDV